ncbi:MAG TPA: hypothetical protein VMR81_07050 [Patescibacteria group bacterium]|nr:hypothetical protein [Patescibacteria group bacterium]
MKKLLLLASYVVSTVLFVIFSYGFVDKNLVLSNNPLYLGLHGWLSALAFNERPLVTGIYLVFLVIFFVLYAWAYRMTKRRELRGRDIILTVAVTYGILVFAYSLVSYDIFNYMTTAKMLFTHHENPYIVMPIEIPNEASLAFTRAANKVALYGPTWLLLSGIPHVLGFGNVWLTMISFKLFVTLWLIGGLYLIYKVTHQWQAVILFGLNPLILIEIVVSGHNDIVMMVLALLGLHLLQKSSVVDKLIGWKALALSILVKGATAVLIVPLLLKLKGNKLYRMSFWLLFAVFIIFTPLREELYPWYAVWFFLFAVVMPSDIAWFEQGLTIAFSIGLELRNLPYMFMGYYAGPGPTLRTLLTVVPVGLYVVWSLRMKRNSLWNGKKT